MIPNPTQSGKVPAITPVYWTLALAAATLAETAGRSGAAALNLDEHQTLGLLALAFAISLMGQWTARTFRPWLYWTTMLGATLLGNAVADQARSLSTLTEPALIALGVCLLATILAFWKLISGHISPSRPQHRDEPLYWMAILISETLGTLLGDWTAHAWGNERPFLLLGLGAIAAILYTRTSLSRTVLFCSTLVLLRPFGADIGELLGNPLALGGFDMSHLSASVSALVFMALVLAGFRQQTRPV